jgi:Fe-S-cluster containining protein
MWLNTFVLMENMNLARFKNRAYRKKKILAKFLQKLAKKNPDGLNKTVAQIDKEVWQEVDCLTCANCCKTMTPTYKPADIKRISAHLKMTPKQFFDKWLWKDEESGDVVNYSTPCQFLGSDNKCSIYEVRPADCVGFPHHNKKPFALYDHVFTDNLHRCPATLRMVEKLNEHFK